MSKQLFSYTGSQWKQVDVSFVQGGIKFVHAAAEAFTVIVSNWNKVYFKGKFMILDCKEWMELPKPFGDDQNIKMVAGKEALYLVTEDTDRDRLFVMGNNTNGILGLGTDNDADQFVEVSIPLGRVTALSSAQYHGLLVMDKKHLYAVGNGYCGKLGLGSDTHSVRVFTKVPLPRDLDQHKIDSVRCGGYYSLLLSEDNRLYACGDNEWSQCSIAGAHSSIHEFTRVNFDHPVRSISCGWHHTLALTNDSQLYACGYNSNNQCGDGPSTVNTLSHVNLSHLPWKIGKLCNHGLPFGTGILSDDGMHMAVVGEYSGTLLRTETDTKILTELPFVVPNGYKIDEFLFSKNCHIVLTPSRNVRVLRCHQFSDIQFATQH